jgi:hypothetical protein
MRKQLFCVLVASSLGLAALAARADVLTFDFSSTGIATLGNSCGMGCNDLRLPGPEMLSLFGAGVLAVFWTMIRRRRQMARMTRLRARRK